VNEFADWVGRSQTMIDILEPARSNALDVALGGTGALILGDDLPLLHHWLYFWDVKPPAALGKDGHPAKGGFLPPVAFSSAAAVGNDGFQNLHDHRY
jgi:3-methylfumaryl-CoA hydratase